MRGPARIHSSVTTVMSIVMVVIGVVLIVRTITAGGGVAATGMLAGILFIVAGAIRLYAQSRMR
jgi:uncharacterized membrane protein HdeD (DUF308 family)